MWGRQLSVSATERAAGEKGGIEIGKKEGRKEITSSNSLLPWALVLSSFKASINKN